MKKMIKMSLVAAVAVAGLTTTSSAAKLTDAIKNTDVTGYVRYRYTNTDTTNETNQYKVDLRISSKVNDKVTAKIRTKTSTTVDGNDNDGAAKAMQITEANFVANIAGTTVIAGKQGLPTPFADADDQSGSGLVAVKPLGAVTVAGGFFTNDASVRPFQTGYANGHNIAALAAIGKANVVNYAVWYANISESSNKIGAQAVNVNLKAKVGKVNVELNTASVDYSTTANGAGVNDQAQTRLVVASKVSNVTVAGAVLVAGKDGADVTLGDTDAKANFKIESFSGSILRDTVAYYVMASAPVGPVTAKVEYGYTADTNGAAAGDTDASETKISASYKMSKNFNVSAFQTIESGALNDDITRVEVKYTF